MDYSIGVWLKNCCHISLHLVMSTKQDVVSTAFDLCCDLSNTAEEVHGWRACPAPKGWLLKCHMVRSLYWHNLHAVWPWTIRHCWLYNGWISSGHLGSSHSTSLANEWSGSNERWWRTACWDLSLTDRMRIREAILTCISVLNDNTEAVSTCISVLNENTWSSINMHQYIEWEYVRQYQHASVYWMTILRQYQHVSVYWMRIREAVSTCISVLNENTWGSINMHPCIEWQYVRQYQHASVYWMRIREAVSTCIRVLNENTWGSINMHQYIEWEYVR